MTFNGTTKGFFIFTWKSSFKTALIFKKIVFYVEVSTNIRPGIKEVIDKKKSEMCFPMEVLNLEKNVFELYLL